ncbi:MAG: sulfotransferase domain-containing protein, partial [Candidatus Hermodarchaeia archaeon]
MLILQIGVPRSGNLWLHNILREILQRAGIERKGFVKKHPIYSEALTWEHFSEQAEIDLIEVTNGQVNFRKGAFVQNVENLDRYLIDCTQVWTHSPRDSKNEQVYRKFGKIIYILRDPRDVAISASRYVFSPFFRNQHPHEEVTPSDYLKNRLYENLLYWVRHVGGYLLHRKTMDIHFIFYENLLND